MAGSGSILGNAVLRLEDPTLLTGEGKYVDDLVEPGMLYVALVRSTVAHGTINSVDVSGADLDARRGRRVPRRRRPGHAADAGLRDVAADFNRPIFASERVRFVGDVIAAVVAESQAQANDAAEAVVADIDPLPAVMTAADGLEPDAPLLFPEHRLERVLRHRVRQGRRRSVRGRRRGRRGHDGEPATGRRTDGEQRRRRRPGGRWGSRCGCRTRRRIRSTARTRRCSVSSPRKLRDRVPVGRWWVRARRPPATSST